jgi:dihydrofolate reductase
MGKLIYSMSVSLDGFVETPNRSLDWVLIDEELHSFFNDEARGMSAFLYGRRMYELMVDYWPTAESDPTATPALLDFARIWKDKPKIVFSRTLERVGWNGRLCATAPWMRLAGSRRSPASTWTSAAQPPPRRSHGLG